MQIIKSLNNNMVLVRDQDGMEKICQGKGIGFQKKKGDILKSTDSVERVFVPENETDRRHFLELFVRNSGRILGDRGEGRRFCQGKVRH